MVPDKRLDRFVIRRKFLLNAKQSSLSSEDQYRHMAVTAPHLSNTPTPDYVALFPGKRH